MTKCIRDKVRLRVKKYVNIMFLILFITILSVFAMKNKEGAKKEFVNPFFYGMESTDLRMNVKYVPWEMSVKKPINATVYLVKEYENGRLYHFKIDPIEYMTEERLNIYFYVTEKEIYRLWSYVYQNERIETFYDDDELIVSILDTEEKIIANGEIVCQNMPNWQEDIEGGWQSNISVEENKVMYTSKVAKKNGEIGFYEWFTWEKEKGLIDYGSGYGVEREILYLTDIQVIK